MPSRRADGITSSRTPASGDQHRLEPPPSSVTATRLLRGDARSRREHLVAGSRFDEPLRRSADAERRQRREQGILPERGRRTPTAARRRRSLTMPAASTAHQRAAPARSARPSPRRGEHTRTRIVSPGRKLRRNRHVGGDHRRDLRIARPCVWRSAISRIGWPDAGTCSTPSGVASEMMSATARVRQPRTLEPKPHAIRVLRDDIRRRLQDGRARRAKSDRPAVLAARESRVVDPEAPQRPTGGRLCRRTDPAITPSGRRSPRSQRDGPSNPPIALMRRASRGCRAPCAHRRCRRRCARYARAERAAAPNRSRDAVGTSMNGAIDDAGSGRPSMRQRRTRRRRPRPARSSSNSASGPSSVISQQRGVARSLPTSALASRCDTGSIGPATGHAARLKAPAAQCPDGR